jgi:hypothetical protein
VSPLYLPVPAGSHHRAISSTNQSHPVVSTIISTHNHAERLSVGTAAALSDCALPAAGGGGQAAAGERDGGPEPVARARGAPRRRHRAADFELHFSKYSLKSTWPWRPASIYLLHVSEACFELLN